MRVLSVRYGITVNLGNYNSERLDVEVELEDGETTAQGFERAKAMIADESVKSRSLLDWLKQYNDTRRTGSGTRTGATG